MTKRFGKLVNQLMLKAMTCVGKSISLVQFLLSKQKNVSLVFPWYYFVKLQSITPYDDIFQPSENATKIVSQEIQIFSGKIIEISHACFIFRLTTWFIFGFTFGCTLTEAKRHKRFYKYW